MKNDELYKIIENQVNAKVSELSTWKKVRWEGGRLYYETSKIAQEISEYDITTQLLYLECLQKKNYIIQDNWPHSAPDITDEFKNWLAQAIAKLKIKIIQEANHVPPKRPSNKGKRRPPIPYKTKTLLLKEIGLKCPFCFNEDVGHFQIHHIDDNPANNDFENLIMLCSICHSKITKGDIGFDEVLFKKKEFGNESFYRGLTDTPLQASKDAAIILELENIKEQYHNIDWDEAAGEEILEKLNKYINHAGKEATYDILLFLSSISDNVRAAVPLSVVESICRLAQLFFPYSYQSNDKRYDLETGTVCISIGNSIAYDSVIYLRQLSYIPHALTLWKHIYRYGKESRNEQLIDKVMMMYSDLESTFRRPERKDLGNALELVKIFKDDLGYGSLAFPPYPSHLVQIIKSEGGYF